MTKTQRKRDLSLWRNIACSKLSMTFEDGKNFNAWRGYTIDDAVISFDNFSDFGRSQLGNHSSNIGERSRAIAAFDQLGNKEGSSVRRILGDKIFNLLKSFQSLFRP